MESTPHTSSTEARKLAAIMFTDIKDFSRKMGRNEAATMKMLDMHNQMISIIVKDHSGTIVKTVGDAFLVSFESVVNAARCAVECQSKFHEYNLEKNAEEIITVRIGIHVGDIIMKDGDVFGDGVNIAARIQPLATPGGVSISEDAARQMRGRFDLPMQKLGRGQLKNIDIPVVIYKIVLPWEKQSRLPSGRVRFVLKQRRRNVILVGAGLVLVLALVMVVRRDMVPAIGLEERSLVILPFHSVADVEFEYLADGIADFIGTELKGANGLSVASRAFVPHDAITATAAEKTTLDLGMRFTLTGSVAIRQDQVAIKLFIRDTKSQEEVYTQGYEVPRDSIFQAARLASSDIATFFEAERVTAKGPSGQISSKALEAFYQGFYGAHRDKKDDNAMAMEYFGSALSMAPDFQRARTALAEAQVRHFERGWNQDPDLLTEAEANCREVLLRDSTNADALSVYGSVEQLKGNQTQAIIYYERALAYDPHNAPSLSKIGFLYLFDLNEPAKAVTYLKRALEREPNSSITNSNIGIGYAQMNNYPEAIKSWRRAIEIDRRDANSWNNLGYAYERLGQYDSAIASYRVGLSSDPTNSLLRRNLTQMLLALGKYSEAESLLVGGLRYLQNDFDLMYGLGVCYSLRGKKTEAHQTFQDGLQLIQSKLQKGAVIDLHGLEALFLARLGRRTEAISAAMSAYQLDSTNNEMVMNVSRMFAIMKDKTSALEWFRRARGMNPEYDVAYLSTALDFEVFRDDRDLLLAARE